MLVLSRKPGEAIHLGKDIVITVVEINGNRVRLGITAPRSVGVLRAELDPLAFPPRADSPLTVPAVTD
jgi:carbon storage regulator